MGGGNRGELFDQPILQNFDFGERCCCLGAGNFDGVRRCWKSGGARGCGGIGAGVPGRLARSQVLEAPVDLGEVFLDPLNEVGRGVFNGFERSPPFPRQLFFEAWNPVCEKTDPACGIAGPEALAAVRTFEFGQPFQRGAGELFQLVEASGCIGSEAERWSVGRGLGP